MCFRMDLHAFVLNGNLIKHTHSLFCGVKFTQKLISERRFDLNNRYTTTLESFTNRYIHLTNYDINKHNPGGFIKEVSDDIEHEGLRWFEL
jgi:hypothetical protein